MSLTRLVASLITARKSGTVDDILADCKGRTRDQVFRALRAAEAAGLIDSDGWQAPKSGSHGSKPTTYRAKRKTHARASSVWEFAQQASCQ